MITTYTYIYQFLIFGTVIEKDTTTNILNIMATKAKKDTCWDGYKKQGTKEKNGKTVPNCVKSSSKKKD
jgi:hypothetical protein